MKNVGKAFKVSGGRMLQVELGFDGSNIKMSNENQNKFEELCGGEPAS